MKIRTEKKDEFKKIYNFTEEVFKTAEVSDGDEQDFVEDLRNSENYIPSLSLVAEENDKIIGHIMLTKNKIIAGSKEYPTLMLSPLSVKLKYRNKGIGSALMREAFKRALKEDYDTIFLVGDPAYYSRFGFKESFSNFDIKEHKRNTR